MTRSKNLFIGLSTFFILLCQLNCAKEEESSIQQENPEVELRAANNIKGQSIQVNFSGIDQQFTLNGEEEWEFNYDTQQKALSAFNTYFLFAPISPFFTQDQIDSAAFQAFIINKCNFWNGTPLERYTLIMGTRVLVCLPRQDIGNLAPQTGWSLVSSNYTNPIEVVLSDIFVASASYQEKAKMGGGWSKRFDFNMGDVGGSSKLSSLKINLIHNGEIIKSTTVNPNTFSVEEASDWLYSNTSNTYFGSLDSYGALSFANNKMVNEIQGINEFDDFNNNNDSGGTRAAVPNLSFSNLASGGLYHIQVIGKVQNNSFESDHFFTIGKDVTTNVVCN